MSKNIPAIPKSDILTESVSKRFKRFQRDEKDRKEHNFYEIFNDLPKGERIIHTYRCAVAKGILIEGRLWLTENFICFKFNWPLNVFFFSLTKTKFAIHFTDITEIKKEKTAKTFNNAKKIYTENLKVVFLLK